MNHRSAESRIASRLNCPVGDVWFGGWAELDEPAEQSEFTAEDRQRFEAKVQEWRAARRVKLLEEVMG